MEYDEFCERVFEQMRRYLKGTEFEDARVRLLVYVDWTGDYRANLELDAPDGHARSVDLYPFYAECGKYGCDDHTLGRILSLWRGL